MTSTKRERRTVAIALFNGELLFSSTILPIDFHRGHPRVRPNGLVGGVTIRKDLAACQWSCAMVLVRFLQKVTYTGRLLVAMLCRA